MAQLPKADCTDSSVCLVLMQGYPGSSRVPCHHVQEKAARCWLTLTADAVQHQGHQNNASSLLPAASSAVTTLPLWFAGDSECLSVPPVSTFAELGIRRGYETYHVTRKTGQAKQLSRMPPNAMLEAARCATTAAKPQPSQKRCF